MTHKQRNSLILFTLLTIIHVLFYNFYPPIYGYMNIHNQLGWFLPIKLLLQIALLLILAVVGFFQLQHHKKKFMLFYVSLFFFNLILLFLFF